jgi:hypothetical protein
MDVAGRGEAGERSLESGPRFSRRSCPRAGLLSRRSCRFGTADEERRNSREKREREREREKGEGERQKRRANLEN